MRARSIYIRGFRGFNDERTILFDERLTLIAAVNSYGKTSISEAFEWLLYGETTKVQQGDYSKDEYKGSYRNCHLQPAANPIVRLVLADDAGTETALEAELVGDQIVRKVNGTPVSNWPFAAALNNAPRPFILQHALKNLLLAKPIDRFTDFSRLLGLEELGELRNEIVSVCTQFRSPQPILQLIATVDALQSRVQANSALGYIAKELKKGSKGLSKVDKLVEKECIGHVPHGTEPAAFLAQLLRIREEAVCKVFKGSVALGQCSDTDRSADSTDENILLAAMADDVTSKYSSLIQLKALRSIADEMSFYEMGVKLLRERKECPFCSQEISAERRERIQKKHADLLEKSKAASEINKTVFDLQQNIRDLQRRLTSCRNRTVSRCNDLIASESSLPQIEKLLSVNHKDHFQSVIENLGPIKSAAHVATTAVEDAYSALALITESVQNSTESLAVITDAAKAIVAAVASVQSCRNLLDQSEGPLAAADVILKHELDLVAGTQDISLLIDLLEHRKHIEQRFAVASVIDGLKQLRSNTEEFVGAKMLSAISGEFAEEVSDWYGKIKTTGDPDVHFVGFDVKKASSGNRVQINAASYGQELVSAVSSLSESKLNALGLCISIAINLHSKSPFDFVVIDDPIQSWDQAHETKFIDVIRELVTEGKQIVLLSHNQQWIRRVRSICDDLNGTFYEITGYTKQGPHIAEVQWAEVKHRLAVVDALLKNPDAGAVELQHAEEEIRIIVNQLTAELHLKKQGTAVSAKNMNSEKVLKLLLACGVEQALVSKIVAVFGTVDPAHHAQEDYAASRDRIRGYHGLATSLSQIVTNTPLKASAAKA